MPIESEEAGKRRFVTEIVPRLAGVGAFLVYLITINPWISFSSLGTVTRISGGAWQPAVSQPLTLALFYPFRFLPASWVPFALNLLTVLAASLALALLARSVALLPHNITPEHLLRKNQPAAILSTPGAWMPPVLAVILCGLQSSFWEHATSATGEMIDLLMFAGVIRCLLEFRVNRESAWLVCCAFLYGAGMANNWAMIAFFPLFAAALLRTAGIDLFLKGRLPLRLALWGAAGLSLYLLLPILHGITPSDQTTFWTALKGNLKSQWTSLSILQRPSFRALAIASLLPLLILSVRWKSHTVQSGDDSRFGVFLTRATGHVIHALLLFTSVWMALDPAFGPRHAVPGASMLSYYYVSALIFGYCTGYFLLLGQGKTRTPLAKRAMAATFILVCALPLLLGWKNLGQLRAINGPALHEFARQLYADLPEGKSVVLSDDPLQLALLQAELRAHRRDQDVVPLETYSLFSPEYQLSVSEQFKSRWPVELPTNHFATVPAGKLLELVSAFARREPVIYLHPSSGLYFENFTGEPQGALFRLLPRPLEDLRLPRLPDAVASRNEEIWQQRWTNGIQRLASQRKVKSPNPSTSRRSLSDWLRLVPGRDFSSAWIGMRYSKALNSWGVELQRIGQLPEAGVWFARALELNHRNVSAKINQSYNERCRQGDPAPLDPASPGAPFRDVAVSFDEWSEIISSDGPIDEPFFLLRTSRMLQASGNIRQAAGGFARCVELAPDWPPSKMQLAQSCIQLGDFAAALALTEDFVATNQLSAPGLASLLDCRATALAKLGRSGDGIAFIEKFVEVYGQHGEVLMAAADLYEQSHRYKEQLAVIDELLRRDANRPALLSRKGLAELRLSRYEDAIGSLTSALSLVPSHNGTRLLRAIACMGADKLDSARIDYQALLEVPDNSLDATFGLATIAWRQQDTNQAIQFYRQYISRGKPDSPQYVLASDRLKQLTSSPVK